MAADDPQAQARNAAFLQELQQLDWTVGRNMRIDYRWGAGDAERIRRYAPELAALAPDVLLATGSVTVAPLLQATRSVPIVFAHVPDPVGAGLVDSLARPGGAANLTIASRGGANRLRENFCYSFAASASQPNRSRRNGRLCTKPNPTAPKPT